MPVARIEVAVRLDAQTQVFTYNCVKQSLADGSDWASSGANFVCKIYDRDDSQPRKKPDGTAMVVIYLAAGQAPQKKRRVVQGRSTRSPKKASLARLSRLRFAELPP